MNVFISAAQKALSHASGMKIVLIGDFCLDVYYHIDSKNLEPSLETGLMVRRAHKQTDSLGGAGNVFANLCALGVGKVTPIGLIGPDMFGAEMQRLMSGMMPGCTPLTIQGEKWTTPTYMKPILDGQEQERIDLGCGNAVTPETIDILLKNAGAAIADADAVMINQQLEGSIYTDRFIDGINALAAAHRDIPFIVDSRSMQDRFHGMWHKLNTHELAALCGITLDPMHSDLPLDEVKSLAEKYYASAGDPVILSRGEKGAMAFDGSQFQSSDGIAFMGELDTVGAGDSFFAGFTMAMAAGLTMGDALGIGNGVAGVTVQKLHQTGTASPEELISLLSSCDYLYNADTAPQYISEPFTAELSCPFEELASRPPIEYAVFDNDGTISVLREGWEEIMEVCMIDAITGGTQVSSEELEQIRSTCRRFITKTTGIQTINQMTMLVDIVRNYGLVEPEDVKTPAQYKAIYNEALLNHIDGRKQMVAQGLLSPEDATVAGSIKLLKTLADAGVKVYLASGTDMDDVRKEASLLGYADLFTGGIYGSVGDVRNDPKRQVLCKILAEEKVDMSKMVIFGDGPVEMRVARDNGALAFGVLSNEVRRYGRNEAKHERLLHAGADIMVGDFLEYQKIADFLLKK